MKPVDAEPIDTAVMERLHDLLPDFDGWITQIEDRHAIERGKLAQRTSRSNCATRSPGRPPTPDPSKT